MLFFQYFIVKNLSWIAKLKELYRTPIYALPRFCYQHFTEFALSLVCPFAAAKLLQSCPTLCGPHRQQPPGSPVPGILQARTLEWVAISFSNAWKWKVKVESLKSCPTLSDPMDCSLPGSSIHGILQAINPLIYTYIYTIYIYTWKRYVHCRKLFISK